LVSDFLSAGSVVVGRTRSGQARSRGLRLGANDCSWSVSLCRLALAVSHSKMQRVFVGRRNGLGAAEEHAARVSDRGSRVLLEVSDRVGIIRPRTGVWEERSPGSFIIELNPNRLLGPSISASQVVLCRAGTHVLMNFRQKEAVFLSFPLDYELWAARECRLMVVGAWPGSVVNFVTSPRRLFERNC